MSAKGGRRVAPRVARGGSPRGQGVRRAAIGRRAAALLPPRPRPSGNCGDHTAGRSLGVAPGTLAVGHVGRVICAPLLLAAGKELPGTGPRQQPHCPTCPWRFIYEAPRPLCSRRRLRRAVFIRALGWRSTNSATLVRALRAAATRAQHDAGCTRRALIRPRYSTRAHSGASRGHRG